MMTKRPLVLATALVILTLFACSDDQTPAPPPIAAGDFKAEYLLTGEPVPLPDAVVAHLEASGMPGGADDTGTAGVDSWEIVVDATRTIGFGMLDLPGARLRLLSSSGAEVATTRSGDAHRSLTLAPGRYRVELINESAQTRMARVGWHDAHLGKALDVPGLYGSVAVAPWPSVHADRRNSGLGIGGGAGLKQRALSRYQPGGGSTIGADGTVYFAAKLPDGIGVVAVPADLSGHRWFSKTDDWATGAPAIAADGTLYIGTWKGTLYAFDHDGTQKWTFKAADSFLMSPQVGTDGTVYIGSDDNHLYAIRPDGTMKWAFDTGGPVEATPAIGDDGTIYIPSTSQQLFAIDANGNKKWALPMSLCPVSISDGFPVDCAAAIGTDGTIYMASGDNNLYAIRPDGTKKWAYTTGASLGMTPAIGPDGGIVVTSGDIYVYKVKPDGTLAWKVQTGEVYNPTAIGTDGTVYVSNNNLGMFAIDGATGVTASHVRFPPDFPIVMGIAIAADGTLYGPSVVLGVTALR